MRNKKKRYLISLIMCSIFIITGCSSDSGKVVKEKESANIVNDNVVLLKKDNDLYLKHPEKDIEKISSNIESDYFEYIDGKDQVIYIDEEGNLQSYQDGKKQKISSEIDYYSENLQPYKLSANQETLAYISNQEESLYAYFPDKDKVKLDSLVSYYQVSDNGQYIYYINEDDELYVYSSDEQKDKIATGVNSFTISSDGTKVIIVTIDGDLYYRDLTEVDKEKIFSEGETYYSLNISDEGNTTYLSEYDYSNSKGELFYKELKEEPIRIASDVVSYQENASVFYYLNADKQLYTKKLNSEKSTLISDDVNDFALVDEIIFYIDFDKNLFKVNNKGEKEKINSDIFVNENEETSWSFINRNVVYLTKDNNLYINSDKISSDVEDFLTYVDTVVYKNKSNEIRSFFVEDQQDNLLISKANEYSSIYYGNQLLSVNKIELEDLTGVWKVEVPDGAVASDFGLPLFINVEHEEDSAELCINTIDQYGDEDTYYGEVIDIYYNGFDFYSHDYKKGFSFVKVNDNEFKLAGNQEYEFLPRLVRTTAEKAEKYMTSIFNDY